MKKTIDFNRLPKQEYMKPAMQMAELKHKCHIMAGSTDQYGMNTHLQGTNSSPSSTSSPTEEATEAW